MRWTVPTMGRLEDMRLFAALAEMGSLSAAGRALGVPKQTVSRRVAAVEEELGVRLVQRTTRQVRLTEAGRAWAERSAEIARLADEAAEVVASTAEVPTGTLRVTTTEGLGEAFLSPVVAAYLAAWPGVRVEALLTERRVDLVAEGFDVAVRVGALDESSLVARRLGPARMRVVASPAYLARRGAPDTPESLATHDCIVHGSEARLARWPFAGPDGVRIVAVSGRLAATHVGMILRAARDGLGIALMPDLLVADDLAEGRLVALLEPFLLPDVGGVWLVTPARRLQAARVRAFLEMACAAGRLR